LFVLCRLTDLCEYCEKEIFMRKQIKDFMSEEMYITLDNYDISQLKNEFLEKALIAKQKINALTSLNQDLKHQFESDLSKYKNFVDENFEIIMVF
jgi:hypothetical protein